MRQSQITKQNQSSVRILHGNLYLDSELYNSFFAGIETVALLPKAPGFLIMPVHSQASGGRLLKVRNARGDRVVTATDFFQECGINYDHESVYSVHWDRELSALFVNLDSSARGL